MSDICSKTIDRLNALRDMMLLPKPIDLDFGNWLDNFQNPDEREIAAYILQHFVCFSDDMINQMLRTVVGRCGYYFTHHDNEWSHNSFKQDCWYSFVQGEDTDHVTDSGYIFTRKLREVLNIPDGRIIKFESLFKKLEESATPQNVILVDDFVGSGAQTDTAWNEHRFGAWNMTLNEHQKLRNHRIIYAPLIVNDMGLHRIKDRCSNLHLEYVHHLKPEYNLFHKDCPCWNKDVDIYRRFVSMMERIADEQGIPKRGGNHVNDMMGFGAQGLAIAFSHGIPDACPAFFYWETTTWKPLKKRPYHR